MTFSGHYIHLKTLLLLSLLTAISGCASTRQLDIESDFPVPLVDKLPVDLGIHLSPDLLGYEHKEKIENSGEWVVPLGPIQQSLFTSLGDGLFRQYAFTDAPPPLSGEPTQQLDGVLQPGIAQVQFSLPQQTRSNYYEVWIKYHFQLFDRAGNLVSEWDLPAYGKASNKNYGSASAGLQAAANAACRDAMAFFSINFPRQPDIRKWIADGTPLVPAPAPQPAQTPDVPQEPSTSDEATSGGESA